MWNKKILCAFSVLYVALVSSHLIFVHLHPPEAVLHVLIALIEVDGVDDAQAQCSMLISCGSGSIFFFCGCEYALLCASAPYTAVAWLKSISVSEFRLLIVNDELVWWIFFLFHFCCRCCCVINCRYLECELTEGSGLCSGWRRFFFLFSIFGDRRTFIQMDSCSMLVLMDVTFRQGVNKN